MYKLGDSLTELYEHYKKSIYSYLYNSTLDSNAAEELTQDIFLKAFRFFNSFRGDSSAKTWIFKIARNTLISHIKKKSKVKEYSLNEAILQDNNHHINNMEIRLYIKKTLKMLNEEERTLILLRDLNGFSYKEIGNIMKFSEGKVKVGIYRARKKFREIYNKMQGEIV